MTATPVLDIEQLLAPISDEQPSGIELDKSVPPISLIRDLCETARNLVKEKQESENNGGLDRFGNPWRKIPEPDWQAVITMGEDILRNQSKDFRVASMLTEALLRVHHLVGLRDGLQLCQGLCSRYWGSIHPAPTEEDGHSATVAALNILVTTAGVIFQAPVVRGVKPGERSSRSCSTLDYLRAKEMEQLTKPEERARRLELGHIPLSEFQAIAGVTEAATIADNLATVLECIDICEKLGDFFRENCLPDEYGEDTAPGLHDFREQLDTVRRLLKELTGDSAQDSETASNEAQDVAAIAGPGAVPQPQAMTRETALQTVEKVAQFFERTEPHSPVYFALRQVIRWGRMPFPELLAELVNDDSVMYQLRKQIGLPEIKAPE